jgi:hypothetical protein
MAGKGILTKCRNAGGKKSEQKFVSKICFEIFQKTDEKNKNPHLKNDFGPRCLVLSLSPSQVSLLSFIYTTNPTFPP